jgi:hypothetical protein
VHQCLKISFVPLANSRHIFIYLFTTEFSHNHACRSPLLFFLIHLGAAMARSTLSLSLALLASASYVCAQALSTFPATPLVEMTFAYSNLVCLTHVWILFFKPPDIMLSLSKPSPLHMFAGLNPGTTFAIRPPRTSSPCVRLRSSITSSVRCV